MVVFVIAAVVVGFLIKARKNMTTILQRHDNLFSLRGDLIGKDIQEELTTYFDYIVYNEDLSQNNFDYSVEV